MILERHDQVHVDKPGRKLYTLAEVTAAVAAERERCAELLSRRMPNPVLNWAEVLIVEALRLARDEVLEQT